MTAIFDSFHNFIVSLGSQPLYTPEDLAYFRGLLFFSIGVSGLILLARLIFGLALLIFEKLRDFFSC